MAASSFGATATRNRDRSVFGTSLLTFLFARLRRALSVGEGEGAALLGLFVPKLFQFVNLVGHGSGEVVGFATVFAEIVKFPLPALLGGADKFPVADADGAVVLVEPPEEIAFRRAVPRER